MQGQPYRLPEFNRYVKMSVAIAREEALYFRHLYIHPEHILLGLIQAKGSITESVLSAINVTAQRVRRVMTENSDAFEKVSDELLARQELAIWKINLDDVLKVIDNVTAKEGKVAPMNYTPKISSTSQQLMSFATETILRRQDRHFSTEHVLLAMFSLQGRNHKVFIEKVGLSPVEVQGMLEHNRGGTQEFKDINNAGSGETK